MTFNRGGGGREPPEQKPPLSLIPYKKNNARGQLDIEAAQETQPAGWLLSQSVSQSASQSVRQFVEAAINRAAQLLPDTSMTLLERCLSTMEIVGCDWGSSNYPQENNAKLLLAPIREQVRRRFIRS